MDGKKEKLFGGAAGLGVGVEDEEGKSGAEKQASMRQPPSPSPPKKHTKKQKTREEKRKEERKRRRKKEKKTYPIKIRNEKLIFI